MQGKERISDEMLDEMLEDEDPSQLFHGGELWLELRRKLAERILDAEMDEHLSRPEERISGNMRNGHNPKTVVTESGPMPLEVPRDRRGTFEPRLVEKYCRRLPGFDDKVIHLFSRGMSTRRIRETVREPCGVEVSHDLIARVTDAVMEEFAEWQSRPLRDTYAIVYLDAIHVKVRDAGSVSTRATYLAIGVDEGGRKEVLGLWLGEHEGAKFRIGVPDELKARA
jgi:putative transposase